MLIKETARIYNLFPRLLGTIPSWMDHFPRIAGMKFNWLFLNPFQQTGFSRSLYSIKDYYKLNPLFYDSEKGQSEMEQLKWMVDEAHKQGLKVMMDLVVNHTAIDHPFTETHKEWYKWDNNEILRPGAWEGENWVSWGDLAEVDNESSSDRDGLWQYWLDMVLYYLDLGFDGFRCDAAYKLPKDFWGFLIGQSKESYPDVTWFAESLGCPIEDTIRLGQSGFQYTFNSSKWWDYEENWCLTQYLENAPYSRSISFPESHDTPRLFEECYGDPKVIEQRYLFSCLFSSGLMIPIGFEYGFKKPLNVVETLPDDYEDVSYDFSGYITQANTLKSQYQIFNEESNIHKVTLGKGENMAIFLKTSLDHKERCLILINKNFSEKETVFIKDYLLFLSWSETIQDISLAPPLANINGTNELTLRPGEIKVFYASIKTESKT